MTNSSSASSSLRSVASTSSLLSTSTTDVIDDCRNDGRVCSFCANLKLLNNILPSKKCDYCRKTKCQFCTLKFPLLHVKKVLPPTMKGNTRICVQCFSRQWQCNGLKPRGGHKNLKQIMPIEDSTSSVTTLMQEERSTSTHQMLKSIESFDHARFSKYISQHNSSSESNGKSKPNSGFIMKFWNEEHRIMISKRMDVWVSLFTTSLMLLCSLIDKFPLGYRVACITSFYVLFLMIHPWRKHFGGPESEHLHSEEKEPQAQRKTNREESSSSTISNASFQSLRTEATTSCASSTTFSSSSCMIEAEAESGATIDPHKNGTSSLEDQWTPGSGILPPTYQRQLVLMEELTQKYSRSDCPWKVVRTSNTYVLSEMTANTKPFPLFKAEMLIHGLSPDQFLDFIDKRTTKERALWDLNIAAFTEIETFSCSNKSSAPLDSDKKCNNNDDGDEITVCHNLQRAFLGGLISARDFCLLYQRHREQKRICFSSVAHPNVPERPDVTRGKLYYSCFQCVEIQDDENNNEKGFKLVYICQVDIGGSLSPRLVYSGTLDNMEKMCKVFKNRKKMLS